MLDSKLVSVFTKYPDVIDTIHFSDQFTGPKPADVSILPCSYIKAWKLFNREVYSDKNSSPVQYLPTFVINVH
jgi:hypothetical protein